MSYQARYSPQEKCQGYQAGYKSKLRSAVAPERAVQTKLHLLDLGTHKQLAVLAEVGIADYPKLELLEGQPDPSDLVSHVPLIILLQLGRAHF